MIGCLLLAVSLITAQETLPTPRRLDPIPAAGDGDEDGGPRGKASLPDLLKQHRAEREALESTFDVVNREFGSKGGMTIDDAEAAALRLRIHEALTRIAKKRPPGSSSGHAGATKKAPSLLAPSLTSPEHVDSHPDTGVPVATVPKDVGSHGLPEGVAANVESTGPKSIDSTSVAYSLVRAGKYDAALTVYQAIDVKETNLEERSTIQYLAATCMRNVGKIEEATNLYREVANAKTDPYIATCAQWQLAAMRWEQSMKDRLADIRKRRSALGTSGGTSP
jgi:hypothetical protein